MNNEFCFLHRCAAATLRPELWGYTQQYEPCFSSGKSIKKYKALPLTTGH
ncbi:MAG: hypothetical protein RMX68_010950 [Aulosira sp. ZfuVER01]|nr:hypothetical protein [Aulosira sp. ZfuVER01]MDZ7998096.1 hypothetical protein [Aulosira sp. DedVER01a]MDZ8050490.1 hypothetical protein [Aulosira sp. ZfuCHP01]